MSELIKKINKEIDNYPFEFVKDTEVKAVTWYSAPFSGCVTALIPGGTKAVLGQRMNTANHYFDLIEGTFPEQLMAEVFAAARAETPIPDRLRGVSFFINLPRLLSDGIRFLPESPMDKNVKYDVQEALSILREELRGACICAARENTEFFRRMVNEGWCSPNMSDEDRTTLLNML